MSNKRRDRESLCDIQEAIDLIASYTQGMTFNKFLDDRKTQDATVRNLEIIGEAAKSISRDFKERHQEIPWKKLAGMRDKLIHFYFGIDYKIVWNIVRKELPKIAIQVKKALS